MNTARPTTHLRVIDIAGVSVRWLLGALVFYMGMSKALHPVEFLKLVRQYELTQSPLLLNAIAAALPWFEAYCGLLLVAGVAVRGTALTLVVLLAPFTWMVLKRALVLGAAQSLPLCAVRFDCGCGAGEVFACYKVFENVVLIAFSTWLMTGAGRRLCLRHSLFS